MSKAIPIAVTTLLVALTLASAHTQDLQKICKARGGEVHELTAQDSVQSCRAMALSSGKSEYELGCREVQNTSRTMWTLPIETSAKVPPLSINLLIDNLDNRVFPPDTIANCAAAWRGK